MSNKVIVFPGPKVTEPAPIIVRVCTLVTLGRIHFALDFIGSAKLLQPDLQVPELLVTARETIATRDVGMALATKPWPLVSRRVRERKSLRPPRQRRET